MKTIEEKIAIMQAYADGKEIEMCAVGDNRWYLAIIPMWNWYENDYRVKQEPELKYRPYANSDECFADIKKHGSWVKDATGQYMNIVFVGDDAITYAGNWISSYENAYHNWVWADDGKPFGILEEE